MSLEEMKKEVEKQKDQDKLSTDVQNLTIERRKSHEQHASIYILEKNEGHVERRKQAWMQHAGYGLDPKWWDAKLLMVKKAQQKHHKVVQSISLDHPQISLGIGDLEYHSSEDETDNDNEDSVIERPPTTIEHGNENQKFDFNINELNDNQRKQFENQQNQMNQLLKNFDNLLAAYQTATTNLDELAKASGLRDKQDNQIKELEFKFQNQFDNQNKTINNLSESIQSIQELMKSINDTQQQISLSIQDSSKTMFEIEKRYKETTHDVTTITEQSKSQSQSEAGTKSSTIELETMQRIENMLLNVTKSMKTMENQMTKLSNDFDEEVTSLSDKIGTVAQYQSRNVQSFQTSNDSEDAPLLKQGGNMELAPKEYVLKRQWCLGFVCCYKYAFGCGCNCC